MNSNFMTVLKHLDAAVISGEYSDSVLTLQYSDGIRTLTGYSSAEIVNLPGNILNIIYPEDSSSVMKAHKSLFSGSDNTVESVLTFRVITKSGKICWLKENLTAVFSSSTGKYQIYGFLTDVTSEKNKEDELNETIKKLNDQISSKDRFINILSHDLRAPFTSILGFSEILLNEPALPSKEKSEYLTYIYDASQNQLQFISYLLDWSRLRTGSLKIEPQRLNAAAIVYNCVSSLTGNAIRKNIEIKVDVKNNLYIEADERLITQVVLNLLSNAVKFSHEESTIEIFASKFNDDQIEFIVRDTGIGMTPEEQQKIFNLEKNFSREGTRGEKGSGFGLAFIKEIVSNHGGDIWFYSEAGNGTEFHFTVPVPSNTILLVAQNGSSDITLENELVKHFPEFTLFHAENGYDAISIISEKHPNLVISSHNMPLMTGIQLIEAIKKGDSALKSPFIIVMEKSESETESKYLKLGVHTVLHKPYEMDSLLRAVRSVLA